MSNTKLNYIFPQYILNLFIEVDLEFVRIGIFKFDFKIFRTLNKWISKMGKTGELVLQLTVFCPKHHKSEPKQHFYQPEINLN